MKPRVVGHTELCLFLLPFLQQGDFTVEALVSALLADFQVIDRDTIPDAAQAGSMARLLKEARQYIADATHDEDPETQRLSWALLVEIDMALAVPSTDREGK